MGPAKWSWSRVILPQDLTKPDGKVNSYECWYYEGTSEGPEKSGIMGFFPSLKAAQDQDSTNSTYTEAHYLFELYDTQTTRTSNEALTYLENLKNLLYKDKYIGGSEEKYKQEAMAMWNCQELIFTKLYNEKNHRIMANIIGYVIYGLLIVGIGLIIACCCFCCNRKKNQDDFQYYNQPNFQN